MEWIETVIKIGGGITALALIWATVKKVVGFGDMLADLKDHSTENYMALLRLTIMSEDMPIGERIVAGHKYLNAGGNGEVKKFLKDKFNITDPVDEAEHYKR